jgi:N-acetylmuramoyl-L-alanine amidase
MAPVSFPNRVWSAVRLTALGLAVCLCVEAATPAVKVGPVRYWSLGEVTRVAIEVSEEFEFTHQRLPNPERVFFDFRNARSAFPGRGVHAIPVGDSLLKQIRVAQTQVSVTRVVLDLEPEVEYQTSRLSNPARLMVELRRSKVAAAAPAPPALQEPPRPARTASRTFAPPKQTAARPVTPLIMTQPPVLRAGASLPKAAALPAFARPAGMGVPQVPPPPPPAPPKTAAAVAAPAAPPVAEPAKRDSTGRRSMTRALGLKVGKVVIDPGHGGHDTGTIGPKGLMEKNLVLDIARRLGELIETRMGAEVAYTRTDDTFVPLEKRTAIANAERADLFISIHANSSPVRTTAGVETYYLNFTSSRESLEVAARENASSQKSVYELKDLLQKIALTDKIDESREFASKVQAAQFAFAARNYPKLRNRGVRKAPFVVLIGASMPSILTEVGFISNPREEALFSKPDHRQKVAEAIFRGVSQYAESLSHFQVARKTAN